ncbi:MAG: c-type cytochrome [Gammaproteobacteria bacterium]|nr:c-type cytochrome [Gammaproteobacteria bacterium]
MSQADEGKALYLDNCATCHGNDGHGGVGIPLALPSFLSQVSDQYLHRTIRVGRPGRIMPPFYRLSDIQIKQIISHIRSWQKSPVPEWSDETIVGNADNGKQLFHKHCVSCHGENAQGGKGTGLMFSRPRNLPITAPALNNQGFLISARAPMIKHTIMHGRKDTPMPAASTLGLDETSVNNIVSYIRSLQLPVVSKKISLEDEPATLVYNSPYNFEETLESVKRSIIGMNFVHIRDQPLDAGLVAEGKESKKQMMVYFCNFNFLYDALAIDPRVGMFLPCRITIVETESGEVKLMSINPRHLSRLFNNNDLDDACNEMHNVYTSILEDATL